MYFCLKTHHIRYIHIPQLFTLYLIINTKKKNTYSFLNNIKCKKCKSFKNYFDKSH